MDNNTIDRRHAFSLAVLFVFGSSVVTGGTRFAGQDTWISLIAATLISIPLLLVFARISSLYPDKNLFEIINTLLGKVVGSIVSVVMTLYCFHIGVLIIRGFTEFVQILALFKTPQFIIGLCIAFLAAWVVKNGEESLGRIGALFFLIVSAMVVLTCLLSLNKIKPENLMPVAEDVGLISKSAVHFLNFPMAESIVLLAVFGYIKKEQGRVKPLVWGVIFGSFLLLLYVLLGLSVLGVPAYEKLYFPFYTVAGTINIGDFLQRIEVIVSGSFVFSTFIRLSLCLFATVKGMSSLTGKKENAVMIFAVAVLMVAASVFMFKNTPELFEYLNFNIICTLPLQIALPLVLWIIAEIRKRKTGQTAPKSVEQKPI